MHNPKRSRAASAGGILQGYLAHNISRCCKTNLYVRLLTTCPDALITWQVIACPEDAFQVVLQKSIPAQIRQLILYISNNEGQVDGFVRELSFAKRRYKHFL